MALLDISEIIRDPDFTSPVTLIPVSESFDDDGNPVYTDGTAVTIQAVVSNDQKTISRLPEALQRDGSIVVRFVMSDAPADFKGRGYDKIKWRDRSFVIVNCFDFEQFGEGFYRLICAPEDSNDGSY